MALVEAPRLAGDFGEGLGLEAVHSLGMIRLFGFRFTAVGTWHRRRMKDEGGRGKGRKDCIQFSMEARKPKG
jgi:hypothetical protein